MDNNFYREALLKLNDIERQILENKCKGLKDRPIWDKLFISEATYYIHKSNIYAKLGLDTVKSYKERAETLKTVVCPIFFTLKPPEIYSEPLPITPPEPPKAELMANPETMAMAIQDGVEEKNEVIFIPPGPIIDYHPRKHFGRLILIGLVILLFLGMAGTIGYLLGNKPAKTIVITAAPNQVMTQTALAIPVIPPTNIPTITSTITLTPSPTITPTDTPIPPTPTEMPTETPVVVLPFKDDFSNGINPPWQVISGNWIIADGRLTITFEEYALKFVAIDDPELENYRVKANISLSAGMMEIGVRYLPSQTNFLAYEYGFWDRNCWVFGPDYELTCIAGEPGKISGNDDIQIDVNGSNFTSYVNGSKLQSISMTDRPKGGIIIGIWCQEGFACPSIDNFSIEPLP